MFRKGQIAGSDESSCGLKNNYGLVLKMRMKSWAVRLGKGYIYRVDYFNCC